MNYRALPIGISDFAEMIKKEYYYADKTLMIRDLLQIKSKVTLYLISFYGRVFGN